MDSLLQAVRERVLADTTSPAYKELNIMTAPVRVVEISRPDADSLRWTLEPDGCGLIAVAHLTARPAAEPSDVAVLVAEWFGSMGPALIWDIAPSPRWDFLAYGTVHPSDSATVFDVAVIEALRNTCSGDECPSYATSPTLGGRRVAWSADGKALVAGREERRALYLRGGWRFDLRTWA